MWADFFRPLILFIMDFLQSFTGDGLVGAGVSLLGGLFGSSSSSPSKQYKYQKKLMNLQNVYNQQNATIAYDRSRQLTQDSALLEKLGKQQAGINTAFGQNGSVSSTSSAPQADAVSIPSGPDVSTSANVLSQGFQNVVSNLLATATTNANVRKLNAEAEGTEIDNISRNYLNMKKAGLLSAQAAKTFQDVAYQSIVNKYADSRLSAEANTANSDALISSANAAVQGAMNEVHYNQEVERLANLKKEGKLTDAQYNTEVKKLDVMRSEIFLNNAKAHDSLSHVDVNRAYAHNLDSLTDLNVIEHYIKDASKDDIIELAHRQVQEHGPQSVSEDMWNIFNNWDKATGWQRMRALAEIVPSLASDFWSGASHSAGSSFGNKVGPEQNTYNYHEYTNSKGEHAVYTRKKVKNYKPSRH